MVQAEDSEVTKAMKEYNVIPDVLTESVSELLKVTFEQNITVNLGNEITPYQTRNQPMLDWNADENSFYTVLCVDPDAPGPDDPFNALLNTWLVGNIPGKDVKSGDVLFEYIASATPKGVGSNRYVILVYKQPSGKINFTEKRIDKFHFEGREKFPLQEFTTKYGLGCPVAGNFYRTFFDLYTLYIYGQVQCCFELNKF
ncbi:protein D3-like [Eupeodes corollae]|uniref:protein D3-like n=1 Tax=Eupeodes corollae TaxID=290404 RepID=UPI0024916E07|nr:protein D3-like [Eupeodes corollae]